jgi:hypothetical protein
MWQKLSNYFCPRSIHKSSEICEQDADLTNGLRFTYKFLTPYLHLSLGCHWTIVTTIQQHYPHFNEFLDNLFNRSAHGPINLVSICNEVAKGYGALIPETNSPTEHFDFCFTPNHIASLTFHSSAGTRKTCVLILGRTLSPDFASVVRLTHNCPNLKRCQCRAWQGTQLDFKHIIEGITCSHVDFDLQPPNGRVFSPELVNFLLNADQWLQSENRKQESEFFHKSLLAFVSDFIDAAESSETTEED